MSNSGAFQGNILPFSLKVRRTIETSISAKNVLWPSFKTGDA
jgi:hypothetical protein